MVGPSIANQNLWSLVVGGGFTMYPLILCSLAVWAVILERLWCFRRLGRALHTFQLEAMALLLRGEEDALRRLCETSLRIPTARLFLGALERRNSKDAKLRASWREALERKRQLMNQELRENLWILGTIASASPFIGLFGTVVGILRSFQEMAQTGSGGFAVVASGISESLIATAAGIVVAVVAVMAYNAFQTYWGKLVLWIRVNLEELSETLSDHGV